MVIRNGSTRRGALLDLCRQRGLKIATAESCTGGLVAAALTEIAGSSDVVDRGFVTYSNAAKQAMLGVPGDDARKFRRGEPADRRGHGARRARHAPVDLAVSITGIAGPGGGSPASRSGSCISPPPHGAAG